MSVANSVRVLPPHPSLANYKKQAKDLVRDFALGHSSALERVRQSHPRFSSQAPSEIKLADAQLVIAREHGDPTWNDFAAHVETTGLDFHGRVDALIMAAIEGRVETAVADVLAEPSLTSANIYAASAVGNADVVRKYLASNSSLVSKPGGPKNRVPLLYAAFSHFITSPDHRPGMVETIKLLLDSGADPNAAYREEPYADYPLSALYAVAGKFNDLGLTETLLDHGANPNDNESLYHSIEHPDLACAKLLLARGAIAEGSNALKHMLDYENLDGIGLLLENGADPNERNPAGETALHWAVFRRRSDECLGLLLAFGAEIEARRIDGMTPYKLAIRQGDQRIANFLKSRGATDKLDDLDRFLSACYSGDRGAALAIIESIPNFVNELSPHDKLWIVDAASDGQTDAVAIMLDAGFDIEARKTNNATSLHWAAWYGHLDVVKLLIAREAEVSVEGANLGSTPLQWALYGSSSNSEVALADYIEIAKALIQADPSRKPDMAFASEKMREQLTNWMTESGMAV